MTSKAQIVCGWCGIATIVLMMIGMGPLGHFAPPPSPLASALETAASFRQNATGILIGSFCIVLASAFSIALVAGISAQIRRMESSSMPVLSYLQLASGAAASLLLILPAMIWSVAAYRPERSPEMIQTLNDLATFACYMPFSVATMEAVVIAVAIFSDRSSRPVFPRWLGFFNLLAGLSYVPMGLLGFSKSGAFASDGLLAWGAPTILVAVWYVLMGACLIRAEKTLPDAGANSFASLA